MSKEVGLSVGAGGELAIHFLPETVREEKEGVKREGRRPDVEEMACVYCVHSLDSNMRCLLHSTEPLNQVTVRISKLLFSPGDFTEDYVTVN